MSCSCLTIFRIICPTCITMEPKSKLFDAIFSSQYYSQVFRSTKISPRSFDLFYILTSWFVLGSTQKICYIHYVQLGVVRNPLRVSNKFYEFFLFFILEGGGIWIIFDINIQQASYPFKVSPFLFLQNFLDVQFLANFDYFVSSITNNKIPQELSNFSKVFEYKYKVKLVCNILDLIFGQYYN